MVLAVKKNWTIWETLLWAEDYLASYDVPDAKTEAEYLLAYVLDCKRMELHLNHASHLSYHILQEFINFVERRIKREPSQYILGEQEFWGLGFKVARDVLIPRPETELIIEETLKLPISHIPHPVILDLCAGSGCIAISLAKELPYSKIYAADISEEALAVARENAERHGVADRIAFIQGNLFEPLRGLNLKADLIVSNPPYISKKMWAELQPEVKDYEPSIALYGGEDGLDFYRRIISESPEYLTAGGCLMLEMGYGQAEKIKNLIVQGNMFENVTIIKDFAGIDRVIKARRKG